MKKILYSFFICFGLFRLNAQINYTFAGVAGAFTQNTGPTVLHGASIDDAISASTAIGFTFQYGCINYTTFQASSNGVMFLGTTAAGTNLGNNLNTSTDRPAIAPLWDDLATGTAGSVNYRLTGTAPNRILTVEWLNMEWSYSATAAVISFQVKLYETSNRIEFVYRQEAAAVVVNGASIGLGGQTSGDFYSLNGTGASPAASKVTETTNLSTKPATGQIYRWDPVLCTGAPVPGAAVASPSLACAAYNSTLTLPTAVNGCGITYQWQSGPAAIGPWTNIGGATSTTAAVSVSATTYYRCILSCGASTAASTPATASLAVGGVCGLCGTVNNITLPYSITGTTTCGSGNDLTVANTAACIGAYNGGEDVVYSFTPTVSGQITITFSTTGSNAAIALYNNCPSSGCIGGLFASSFNGNVFLCRNVVAGTPYFLQVDNLPGPTCLGYNLSISAVTSTASVCSLSTYTATGTTYNFETFVGTNAPQTDDILFNNTVNLGFNFCFGGSQYSTAYIASNGAIVFNGVPCFPNIQTTTYAAPGVGTGYVISAAAPVNNTSIPRNAILGPWHDIDPSVGGLIEYTTLGVAPNRRFIVSYDNVPMFSGSCNTNAALNFSGQIKIFETTGNIEVHVRNKQLCTSWNGGYAVMGLHNFDGTIYRPPTASMTAHNFPTQWTMTNTGYRWTSPCASCAVLPVEFKKFYGERVEGVNKLYWETAMEEDILYFSVERSSDAENFKEIAKVDPKNLPALYTYDDHDTKPGSMYYYRITSVEKNGERKHTNVIPLGSNLNEVLVSGIYPNPVEDDFVMSVDARSSTELQVRIYDVVGKLVKEFKPTMPIGVNQIKFSVPELPAGSYMLEVRSADDQIITQHKLVKVD